MVVNYLAPMDITATSKRFDGTLPRRTRRHHPCPSVVLGLGLPKILIIGTLSTITLRIPDGVLNRLHTTYGGSDGQGHEAATYP